MVSLRWLALFHDFGWAREANWGQACLAYLYLSLDILNRGTLRQLVGPWKLFKVSSFFLFFCSFLQTCTSYLCKLCSFICHLGLQNCISYFCKLCPCFYSVNYHLATISVFCKLSSCKLYLVHPMNCHLFSCKISSCKLSFIVIQTIISFLANYYLANCVFSFQRWAMKYGLITYAAEVDLRSFPSIRAHFKELSSE